MSATKVYCVVFFDAAIEELGDLVKLWAKKSAMGQYIYAQKIDPNGNYFHMWVKDAAPDGQTIEFELQVPHAFVKAVFYAADVKRVGFV